MLLKMVMDVANFSPWVVGLMLSGALAAAMSTGANLAHTAAIVLVRDVMGPTVMKNASEKTTVSVTRWSVLGLSLAAYLIALFNPGSLVMILLTAYGVIIQLFPMMIGALFMPQLRRASVMAGTLVGSLAFLLMEFVWSSPLGWHAGVWAMLFNVAAVAAWQRLGHASHDGHRVPNTSSH
ncbi:sodium:solute symporter family transporter [Modicisalibacter luteus]|uniref:sodium:solute symporter family transporter n=1 Tax=Modicisalibacter luteus TaxID=453962 RepID=UPI003629FB83